MLRIFVGPGSLGKDLGFERNFLAPSSSSFAVLPIDSFGHVVPPISFDSQANLIQYPGITTTKCGQLQMDDHVGTDGRCSITPNAAPNDDLFGREEVHPKREQYSNWHGGFPGVESAQNDQPNAFQTRSTSKPSKNSPPWRPFKIDPPSPESQFTIEDIGSSNVSASTPDLLHPVPRHSPYAVTSYFASEKVPETISAFGQTEESPQEGCMSEGNPHLVRGSDWTSDDLVFPSLLHDCQSPGTTSVITVAEKHTSAPTDSTCDNIPGPPWPSLKSQLPWDTQQSNAIQNEGEVVWNSARVYPDIDQQQSHFGQFPVSSGAAASDEINGLPCVGRSLETYVQPSSLLGPCGSTFPSIYPNGNAITHPQPNQFPYSGDEFAYQSVFRLNNMTGSFFNTLGHISYQPTLATRMTSCTSDAKNALLIECKRRGLSYKDIKRLCGFTEAESTLRGRYRTLTKSKEQRVRRPQWHDNDVRLLREAVNLYSDADRRGTCLSTCRSRRPIPPPRIPWKKVAQYILANGGSYHFGNSTCKKKWFEEQSRHGG